MRLIDADVLNPDMKTFLSAYSEELTESYSQKAINNAPTIEAEPVRHSKWISQNNSSHKFCESCGVGFNIHFYEKNDYRFCPYCGAKMDRGIEK